MYGVAFVRCGLCTVWPLYGVVCLARSLWRLRYQISGKGNRMSILRTPNQIPRSQRYQKCPNSSSSTSGTLVGTRPQPLMVVDDGGATAISRFAMPALVLVFFSPPSPICRLKMVSEMMSSKLFSWLPCEKMWQRSLAPTRPAPPSTFRHSSRTRKAWWVSYL